MTHKTTRGFALIIVLWTIMVGSFAVVTVLGRMGTQTHITGTQRRAMYVNYQADTLLQIAMIHARTKANSGALDDLLATDYDPCDSDIDCTLGSTKFDGVVNYSNNREDPVSDTDDKDNTIWVRVEGTSKVNNERRIANAMISLPTEDDTGAMTLYTQPTLGNSFDPYIIVTGDGCEEVPAFVVDGDINCLSQGWNEPGNDFWLRGKIFSTGTVSCENGTDTIFNDRPETLGWDPSLYTDRDVETMETLTPPPEDICKVSSYRDAANFVLTSDQRILKDGVDVTSTYARSTGTWCDPSLGNEPFVYNPNRLRWEICEITGTFKDDLDHKTVYAETTLLSERPQGFVGDVTSLADDEFVNTTFVTEEHLMIRDLSGPERTMMMQHNSNDSNKMLFVVGKTMDMLQNGYHMDESYFKGSICVEGQARIHAGNCPKHFDPFFNRPTYAGVNVGCAADPNEELGTIPIGQPVSSLIIEGRLVIGGKDVTPYPWMDYWFENFAWDGTFTYLQGDLVLVMECNEYQSVLSNGGGSGAGVTVVAYYEM